MAEMAAIFLPCDPFAVCRIAEDFLLACFRIRVQGFHELPAHMCPAGGVPGSDPVVAGELVVHEDALEAFEESLCVLPAPAGPVFEDADVRAPGIQRARCIEPHPGAFPVDLHGGLVGVEHGGCKELRLHVLDEWEEVIAAERDGPVRHVRPAERESELRPCAFLPVERDGEHVFLAEDAGGERRRGHGMRQEGRRHVRALDAEAVFRLARGALVIHLVDVDDLDLLRDAAHFRPHELLAEQHERRSRMAVAEAFRFRQVDDFLFVRKRLQELVAVPLRLARVRFHDRAAVHGFRLARLGFFLGFVEEGDLLVIRLEDAKLLGFPSVHGLAELRVPCERFFEL